MWTGINLAATLILLAAAGTNAQQKVRKNHTIDQTVPLVSTMSLAGARAESELGSERTLSILPTSIRIYKTGEWFSFGGNAYVNTNKHVRLTRDKPSQSGWLWSRLPLTASSYEIIIEFKASSNGFAMWLTDTRAEPGPVFGSVDNFVGLGIFIDTYANSRHTYAFPRIMGMLGDGKTSYDSGNDGASNELAACSANIRKTEIATKLKLTYFKDEYLNVQIQYKGWDEWTECFTVHDVSLPNTPYLGFTAHTGDVSDNHDIISVATSSAILAEAPINKPTKHASASGSGFWTFLSLLVKIAGVALFGVAALAGYRAYARNAKRRGGTFGGLGGVPHWDNKHF
ncbi:unnamed protein product [Rhizoctonia solani]|uniref:L-type lectin-like domain-containing protein n=1 Tax=Rhizoctonia solani TaxID=456999 RepID=A0A8H3CNJ7_9AGAM|nr:unnamed protein product [Rhizoctonia solani]